MGRLNGARRTGKIGLVSSMTAAALLLAGCSGSGNEEGQSDDVDPSELVVPVLLRELAFDPAEVEIPAGATITWTAVDVMAHTVTSGEPDAPDGQFQEHLETRGHAASFTFDEPGTYAYFCELHPDQMTGTVTVTS